MSIIRLGALPAKAADLEVYAEADGHVVYQPARDKVHFLNHTAVFVLELCDGRLSAGEIIEIYRETFPPAREPEQDVNTLLGRLLEEELIRIVQPEAAASPAT